MSPKFNYFTTYITPKLYQCQISCSSVFNQTNTDRQPHRYRYNNTQHNVLRLSNNAWTPTYCLYHTKPTVYTVRPVRSMHTVTPKSTPDTVSYGQHVRSPRSARTVSTVMHGRPYGLYGRTYSLYGRSYVYTVSCYGHPERYK